MAEETCSTSQESLPLSEETCKVLLDNLDDDFNTLMSDVLKEKTLEERFSEISQALEEEVAKSNQLIKLNAEMKATILDLQEKLKAEIKGRQETEQIKLLIEIRLNEELRKKKVQIDELQTKLAKTEDELNKMCLMCNKETSAKTQALQRLQEIESHSCDIFDLGYERATQGHVQNLKFNEEEDLKEFGEFPLMEEDLNAFTEFPPMVEDLYGNQLTNKVLKTSSSLPATESWPGDFDFKVFFPAQENTKAQWVYSALQNKLYVKKDAPCQINFSTNSFMLDDFIIRTMPFFSSLEDILEKVHRCVNHSMKEIQNNKAYAEHLVRVESVNALYESDHITGRHSVVVPFENPPAGQQFSSYIFKFACFQSCSGGPNRRPLMLLFTLEKRGVVVGRQKVHLKICACPVRDFKSDEKQTLKSPETKMEAIKREREEPFENSSPKRMPVKIRPGLDSGPYYLKVDDRRNYDFLRVIKVVLQSSNEPLRRSNLLNLIRSNYSSSEEEERK